MSSRHRKKSFTQKLFLELLPDDCYAINPALPVISLKKYFYFLKKKNLQKKLFLTKVRKCFFASFAPGQIEYTIFYLKM